MKLPRIEKYYKKGPATKHKCLEIKSFGYSNILIWNLKNEEHVLHSCNVHRSILLFSNPESRQPSNRLHIPMRFQIQICIQCISKKKIRV